MFTVSHCQDKVSCPQGNCPGCKNGKLWCHDPRCDPDCTDCELRLNHDKITNLVIIIILIALSVILVVFIVGFGPGTVYYYVPANQFSGLRKPSQA